MDLPLYHRPDKSVWPTDQAAGPPIKLLAAPIKLLSAPSLRSGRASRRRQHQLHSLAPRHAESNAERFGLRRGVNDLGIEQVFRVDEGLLRRAAGYGDGL